MPSEKSPNDTTYDFMFDEVGKLIELRRKQFNPATELQSNLLKALQALPEEVVFANELGITISRTKQDVFRYALDTVVNLDLAQVAIDENLSSFPSGIRELVIKAREEYLAKNRLHD